MKDDRLLINSSASNYCLCHRNVFQNDVNTFSKQFNHFLPKSSNFCIFRTILFKFHQYVVQLIIKYFMERLQTSNVSVSNGNIKFPIGKLTFALNLPLKHFHATVANAKTGSLKSLHTLYDTCLNHMLAIFEPMRMV